MTAFSSSSSRLDGSSWRLLCVAILSLVNGLMVLSVFPPTHQTGGLAGTEKRRGNGSEANRLIIRKGKESQTLNKNCQTVRKMNQCLANKVRTKKFGSGKWVVTKGDAGRRRDVRCDPVRRRQLEYPVVKRKGIERSVDQNRERKCINKRGLISSVSVKKPKTKLTASYFSKSKTADVLQFGGESGKIMRRSATFKEVFEVEKLVIFFIISKIFSKRIEKYRTPKNISSVFLLHQQNKFEIKSLDCFSVELVDPTAGRWNGL